MATIDWRLQEAKDLAEQGDEVTIIRAWDAALEQPEPLRTHRLLSVLMAMAMRSGHYTIAQELDTTTTWLLEEHTATGDHCRLMPRLDVDPAADQVRARS